MGTRIRPGLKLPYIPIVLICFQIFTGSEIFAGSPEAERTLVLNDSGRVHEFGQLIEILEDPAGELSFADVQASPWKSRFIKSPATVPNYGFTGSVFWVRFRLRNNTDISRWNLQVAYPPLDSIRFYLPGEVGSRKIKNQGDLLPFGERDLNHPTSIILLNLEPNREEDYYIRFESQGTLQFPLNLMISESLRRKDQEEQFAFGAYYGIIGVLALYNFILFFIVRDSSFFYYLLYVTGYGLIQFNLNGLAYQYLWPDWPWWSNRSLPFSIGWTFLWSLQFTRTFLHTRENTPRMDRFMRALMGGMIALMVSSIFVAYRFNINLAALLVIAFSITVLLASLLCWKTGFRSARYFLIAWVALLVGVSVFAMKGLGILPSNFFTEYGLQIGSAVEMALLSIGLGDRINVMNLEREEARRLTQEAHLVTARLEIELLKKNIQPHFLLNSINATIVWLQEDPRNATRLLNSLADELRMLLHFSGKKMITLEQELELCRAHLQVMSLRHDKNFILETKGITGEEEIPPLVIHTLIENGLTHGYAGRDEGRFVLSREKSAGGARYTLWNDGENIAHKKGEVGSGGMGLKYVRTRLEESYPGKWRLESGAVSDGWRVWVEIDRQATKPGR